MALLGTITKQPAEKLPYDISYASVLNGRTGTVGTPTVTSGALTISDELVDGAVFQFYIGGGTDGLAQKIEITVDITVGGKVETVQDELMVLVEEV